MILEGDPAGSARRPAPRPARPDPTCRAEQALTAGLSDAELTRLGSAAGLDTAFAACVSAGTYLDWPPYVTELATAAGVSATPTVLVAGAAVRPDPEMITAAVAQVARQP